MFKILTTWSSEQDCYWREESNFNDQDFVQQKHDFSDDFSSTSQTIDHLCVVIEHDWLKASEKDVQIVWHQSHSHSDEECESIWVSASDTRRDFLSYLYKCWVDDQIKVHIYIAEQAISQSSWTDCNWWTASDQRLSFLSWLLLLTLYSKDDTEKSTMSWINDHLWSRNLSDSDEYYTV